MRRKVLLIDDSLTIHKIVELTINREAFDLFGAKDHVDGINIAAKENVDCILVDNIICSDEENYAEKLLAAAPNASIILLVGAYDQFLDTASNTPKITDYIVKPFNASTLNHAVEAAIAKQSETPKQVVSPAVEPAKNITDSVGILADDVRSLLGDEIANILSELETTDHPSDEEIGHISEEAAKIAAEYEQELAEKEESITITYQPATEPMPAIAPKISPIEEDLTVDILENIFANKPELQNSIDNEPPKPELEEIALADAANKPEAALTESVNLEEGANKEEDFTQGVGLEVLESYLFEEIAESPLNGAKQPQPQLTPPLPTQEEIIPQTDFPQGLEMLESYEEIAKSLSYIEQDVELEMLQSSAAQAPSIVSGFPPVLSSDINHIEDVVLGSKSVLLEGEQSYLSSDVEDISETLFSAPVAETAEHVLDEVMDFSSANVEIGATNEKLFTSEVNERMEILSMFDGDSLNINPEKDEPVKSGFKKIAEQNDISTNTEICKLTIEITKEEFVDIFRKYLDRNTIDFLLYDTVRDAISKVLPDMVEKMIRREILKMLKG